MASKRRNKYICSDWGVPPGDPNESKTFSSKKNLFKFLLENNPEIFIWRFKYPGSDGTNEFKTRTHFYSKKMTHRQRQKEACINQCAEPNYGNNMGKFPFPDGFSNLVEGFCRNNPLSESAVSCELVDPESKAPAAESKAPAAESKTPAVAPAAESKTPAVAPAVAPAEDSESKAPAVAPAVAPAEGSESKAPLGGWTIPAEKYYLNIEGDNSLKEWINDQSEIRKRKRTTLHYFSFDRRTWEDYSRKEISDDIKRKVLYLILNSYELKDMEHVNKFLEVLPFFDRDFLDYSSCLYREKDEQQPLYSDFLSDFKDKILISFFYTVIEIITRCLVIHDEERFETLFGNLELNNFKDKKNVDFRSIIFNIMNIILMYLINYFEVSEHEWKSDIFNIREILSIFDNEGFSPEEDEETLQELKDLQNDFLQKLKAHLYIIAEILINEPKLRQDFPICERIYPNSVYLKNKIWQDFSFDKYNRVLGLVNGPQSWISDDKLLPVLETFCSQEAPASEEKRPEALSSEEKAPPIEELDFADKRENKREKIETSGEYAITTGPGLLDSRTQKLTQNSFVYPSNEFDANRCAKDSTKDSDYVLSIQRARQYMHIPEDELGKGVEIEGYKEQLLGKLSIGEPEGETKTGHLKSLPLLGVSGNRRGQPDYEKKMFEICNLYLRALIDAPPGLALENSGVARLLNIYIELDFEEDLKFYVMHPISEKYEELFKKAAGFSIQSINLKTLNDMLQNPQNYNRPDMLQDFITQIINFFFALVNQDNNVLLNFLKSIIKKHYLLPEIMSYLKQGKIIKISLDNYISRTSQSALGMHKDTYSCNTFRALLSFNNPSPMYGTEIIQCHSVLGPDENRCEMVFRPELPPYSTISFNDFLLAHSSPCNLLSDVSAVKHKVNSQASVSSHGVTARNLKGTKISHTYLSDKKRGKKTLNWNSFSLELPAGQPNSDRPPFIRQWFDVVDRDELEQSIRANSNLQKNSTYPLAGGFSFVINPSELLLSNTVTVIESRNVKQGLEALLSNDLDHLRCGGYIKKYKKKHKKTKKHKHKKKHKKTKKHKHNKKNKKTKKKKNKKIQKKTKKY